MTISLAPAAATAILSAAGDGGDRAAGWLIGATADGATRVLAAVGRGAAASEADDRVATDRLLPGGLSIVGAYAPTLAAAAAAADRGGIAAAPDGDGGVAVSVGGAPAVPADADADAAPSPSSPPRHDAWLARTHAAVRVTLAVARGRGGAAAARAELCGDGDDPGDAVFAVPAGDGGGGGGVTLLAGAQPVALGPVDAPVLATPLARPPAPPPPPPAPVAVVDGAAPAGPSLLLDALAYVPRGASGADAAAALRRALARQLAAAAAARAGGPLRFAHFMPPPAAVPLSPGLPLPPGPARGDAVAAAEADPAAAAGRAAIAARVGAAADAPCFRLSAALHGRRVGGGGAHADDDDDDPRSPGGGLLNVHTAIPSPPPPSFTVTTVAGAYRYRHYAMDGFDDVGWGCAYRSLQTLASWLREQHYTYRAPPSHAEVQATLVRLNDKPPSFAGSRQWVGALELSYVLDELYGVTCKVITVNRGSDMPSHARALAHHFATQGTPVMVGGGVLAYTMLGVALDEGSGEARFLILDPHYVGPSDAAAIAKGGWVAWRGPGDGAAAGGPLFVGDAFYNLLCPQRPRAV